MGVAPIQGPVRGLAEREEPMNALTEVLFYRGKKKQDDALAAREAAWKKIESQERALDSAGGIISALEGDLTNCRRIIWTLLRQRPGFTARIPDTSTQFWTSDKATLAEYYDTAHCCTVLVATHADDPRE